MSDNHLRLKEGPWRPVVLDQGSRSVSKLQSNLEFPMITLVLHHQHIVPLRWHLFAVSHHLQPLLMQSVLLPRIRHIAGFTCRKRPLSSEAPSNAGTSYGVSACTLGGAQWRTGRGGWTECFSFFYLFNNYKANLCTAFLSVSLCSIASTCFKMYKKAYSIEDD